MEIYCDHSRDSDDYDDDKFLLDDENTEQMRRGACIKCRRSSSSNGIIKPQIIHQTTEIADSSYIDSFGDASLLINGEHFGTDCERLFQSDFHCHSMNPVEPNDKKALRKLIAVSFLCLFFMITELVGGYLADSLSVMTDAAHLFSDLIGFLISILSIWISRKSPTSTMTFGYHRAEVLGALLSVVAIWLLAGTFAILAVRRLAIGEFVIEVDTMLIVASIGVIVNIIMGVVLHSVCHAHSHDFQMSSSDENINVRAASAHVLGDLLQSVGVLIAAIVIKIFPNAKIADPICTLTFSFIVVYATIHVAYDAIKILAEASPKDVNNISLLLMNIPGVKHVHELHTWSLSPGKNAFTAHLAVDQGCDREYILKQATSIVRSRLKMVSCTMQIEKYHERMIESCNQCQAYS